LPLKEIYRVDAEGKQGLRPRNFALARFWKEEGGRGRTHKKRASGRGSGRVRPLMREDKLALSIGPISGELGWGVREPMLPFTPSARRGTPETTDRKSSTHSPSTFSYCATNCAPWCMRGRFAAPGDPGGFPPSRGAGNGRKHGPDAARRACPSVGRRLRRTGIAKD